MDTESSYREDAEITALARFAQEMNASFYQGVSESFSQSRNRPWKGWEWILEEIKGGLFLQHDHPLAGPLKVLDLGCGNARFGVYLQEQLPSPLHYVGIDNSRALLEEAKKNLPSQTFLERDLTEPEHLNSAKPVDLDRTKLKDPDSSRASNPFDVVADSFDVVACFGVLHHLYGVQARKSLIERALGALTTPGLACFSFWQPLNNGRYHEQSEASIAQLRMQFPRVRFEDFGTQDLFLSWQGRHDVFRYVHSFTKPEIENLLETAIGRKKDVKIRTVFKTLAGNDSNNVYAILQKG